MYSVYKIQGVKTQLVESSHDVDDVRLAVQVLTADMDEAQEAMEYAKTLDPGESFDSPFDDFIYRVTCEQEVRKMSNNDIGKDWIIAIANSAVNGVIICRFRGTDDEVKEKLLELLNQDKENDEEAFDYGTEDIESIDITGKEYNAYAIYSEYHIDYTAKCWCDVDFV